MKALGSSWAGFALAVAVGVGSSGCAAFRVKTQDVDVADMEAYDADYSARDMRKITENLATSISVSPFLEGHDVPPIMMIAGVQNRTKEYVDTKNLTDRLRTLLIQSGRIQFINEARRDDLLREQGYQAAQATPETQAAIGQQLGARYMVSGSLTEMAQRTGRQVRVSKTEMKYYKLTLEVTDLTTGLIVWTDEEEFARTARTPLIGW
ncbi:MAG: penicillin-binding protein activator LpoB [Candidatus Marinimicrobia bacterium]|nr:penicillin-binding protein activator LpoB [Candidatus Neomarinimicrobiota bacterium]